MESMSFRQLQVIEDQLKQIREAILNLQEWNKSMSSADDFHLSPEGVKTLAADCMLIEAIGEGFKRIDNKTNNSLLPLCPEIPWKQVIGMRDHIAHGYFDINSEFVWDVIHNDLQPLLVATDFLLINLFDIIPADDEK